jgi:glucose-1-phosphate cytidylyltransferase
MGVEMSENIPVVILCGGLGTRLAEQTEMRPKPMVEIGGHPILWHIMKHYSHYGYNEFVLALGYKGEQIKRYFFEFSTLSRDFTISVKDGQVRMLGDNGGENWTIHLVDTGSDTLTGGRIKRLEHLIGGKTFMMTYGDGVAPVDIPNLLAFHRSHGGLVTLSAVHPPARFGALEFEGNRICHFKEKSVLHEGWINGGFFVIEPAAFQYIEGDVMWEHAPMERLAEIGQLYSYKHDGFWQCMDTLRDLRFLESMWDNGNPLWKTW